MSRKLTGTIGKYDDGDWWVRLTVRIAHVGGHKLQRPRIRLAALHDKSEVEQFALDVATHVRARVLSPDEYHRLISGAVNTTGFGVSECTTVAEFYFGVYAPTRETMSSCDAEASNFKNHILPCIGHLPVKHFEGNALRKLVKVLDARILDPEIKFSGNTGRIVWGSVRAFCSAMLSSKNDEIRIRTDNPALDVRAPEMTPEKAVQWLYPHEMLIYLACESVPLLERRLAAVSHLLFARPSEVLGLEWGHSFDLRHGMVLIDQKVDPRTGVFARHTKTRDIRSFPIPETLLPLLRVMDSEKGDERFPFLRDHDSVAKFRAGLLAAGVTRTELHIESSQSKKIRLHDLRGTGLTYLSIIGASDDKVRIFSGHRDRKVIERYLRRGHRDAKHIGVPFSPLPHCLLYPSAPSSLPRPRRGRPRLAPKSNLRTTSTSVVETQQGSELPFELDLVEPLMETRFESALGCQAGSAQLPSLEDWLLKDLRGPEMKGTS